MILFAKINIGLDGSRFDRNQFTAVTVVEIITESLKVDEKKEKKTKDKKAVENGTEKIEDVANDVDAAAKKKPPAGKGAKKEAEKAEEAEKPKGDPPVIEGKIEDLVSGRVIVFNKP